MISLNPIIVVEIFDVQGIDFMGSFPCFFRNEYILLVIECVSKWLEVILTRTNDAKVDVKFHRENIFGRFGMLRTVINDGALTLLTDLLMPY